MTAATRRRAAHAIALFKGLTRAQLRGSELVLPEGRIFSDRELDDHFESGDGEDVAVPIMQERCGDAELRHALVSGYASAHVDLAGWTRTLGQWEARQPGFLPFD